jgi:Trk-type K+ transport system membrane component
MWRVDATWVQLLLGLLIVVLFFLTVAAGVVFLAFTPVREQPAAPTGSWWRSRFRGQRLRSGALQVIRAVRGRARRSTALAPVGMWAKQVVRHPARMVVLGFAAAITVGWALLALPVATQSGRSAGAVTALFTATSAVCVTGLVTVDTGSHWSGFGQGVILTLIQVGGFGIMTLASLLGLLVARRLRLRLQRGTQAETKALGLGDVRRVVFGVVRISLLVETALAGVLTWRFADGYGEPWGRAAYLGVFHAVSAFNNAGFGLYADSLMR